jgi:DnaJ-class molecular chaperone
MKDYYYILGVTSKASLEEIKKAYRKLSTKFHPDKNDGDAFFEERFKEIQEAYEVLSNAVQRPAYDRQYEQRFGNASSGSNGTSYNNFYPVIDTFTASSNKIYDGDEVEFRWNVFNADNVQIDKVGSLPPKGTKKIRISGLRSSKSIRVTLTATNTHIGKSESKTIELMNRAYEDIREEVKREAHRFEKNELKDKKNNTTVHEGDEIPWTVIVFILATILGISILFIAMQ